MNATGPRPDPAQGIYETVRVSGGRVHLLAEHLARLQVSLQALYGLAAPAIGAEDVLAAAHAAAAGHDARVRIDVVLTGNPPGRVTYTGRAVAPGPPAPVTLAPVHVPGGLGPHKWRDRRIVDALGADPVPLLVDDGDEVLEAGWGNVWALDDDRLITPPADGRILPGVTRAQLLRRAGELGVAAAERRLTLDELRAAPVVFVTSAIRLAVSATLGGPAAEHPRVAAIRDALAVF